MTIEAVIGELTSVVVLAVLGSVGSVAIVSVALYLLEIVKGLLRD